MSHNRSICSMFAFTLFAFSLGCGAQTPDEAALSQLPEELLDCVTACWGIHGRGHMYTSIPADGTYYLTSFNDSMKACDHLKPTATPYFAASSQRYGCLTRLAVTTGRKCLVVEVQDAGADRCVDDCATKPVLDLSPASVNYLSGRPSAGWSDHFKVKATPVSLATPLGACAGTLAAELLEQTEDSPAAVE